MPQSPQRQKTAPRDASSRRAWYIDAAATEREVKLVTIGRKSGKPRRVTIWITTDGERVYIRSGAGLDRDWPQNLMARGSAILSLGGRDLEVKPRPRNRPRGGAIDVAARSRQVRQLRQTVQAG